MCGRPQHVIALGRPDKTRPPVAEVSVQVLGNLLVDGQIVAALNSAVLQLVLLVLEPVRAVGNLVEVDGLVLVALRPDLVAHLSDIDGTHWVRGDNPDHHQVAEEQRLVLEGPGALEVVSQTRGYVYEDGDRVLALFIFNERLDDFDGRVPRLVESILFVPAVGDGCGDVVYSFVRFGAFRPPRLGRRNGGLKPQPEFGELTQEPFLVTRQLCA